MSRSLRLVRAAGAASLIAPLLTAARAAADHGIGDLRTEGLGPLAVALVTGGLALAAALLVVVIVMLLTRKSPVSEPPGE